jgi:hypothetical protein
LISRLPEAERAITELPVLEKLATIYFFCSDIRCIETYEGLTERASTYGNIEVEIRALLDWSYCLSSIHADRSLELIERALGLIDALEDDVLSARAKMSCLAARIWFGGWRPRDAEEVRRMVPLIRQTSDRELLAPYLVDYSMIQWASSEYREAHQSVSEAVEILTQERTENLYLSLAYQKSQIYSEDIESSQRHREISRVAILKLSNSLAPEDPLRKTFLSALSITKIIAEPVGEIILQAPVQ